MHRISRVPLGERTPALAEVGEVVRVLRRIGMLQPVRPDRLVHMSGLRRWGFTMAGGFAANAKRHPHRLAVVDERRSLTFDALHRRSNALAHGLLDAASEEHTTVAMLCRNHRGFLSTTVALAKLGADGAPPNTGFGAPQLREVLARERPGGDRLRPGVPRLVQAAAPGAGFRRRPDGSTTDRTLDGLVSAETSQTRDRLGRDARSSSPQGRPEHLVACPGADEQRRSARGAVLRAAAAGGRIDGDRCVPASTPGDTRTLPSALLLDRPSFCSRRFEPPRSSRPWSRHRATVLVAVPVMLQRILDVPELTRRALDVSSLRGWPRAVPRCRAASRHRFMDTYGDVLYNLYGSTEVGVRVLATPDDLRTAPGTAGRPLRARPSRSWTGEAQPAPAGTRGHIFVGNELLFGGYTGGGTRRRVRELISTGDVGRFDPEGRLNVEGRADDMIVSGGENVFPEEVEQLLADHEAIAEVAVVGVADERFGQRLKASRRARTSDA